MSTYDNQTGRLAPQSMLKQRYLIVGPAGRGGMSAVYQAVDTQAGNRRVAIKEMSQGHLNPDELTGATARFQQEAALLSSLHHPNLPRIYDAFSEHGRSYLVMEYIDGKTLLQMLKDSAGHQLPVAQVLSYASQLCDVLTYLHAQNPPIIFRDLKPANVMVKDNGRVMLIDFGIARFFKEGQAQDTVFLGSPGYAPPEQHGLSQTNPRSDLYALGATLHCCLTGRDPFLANDRFAFPPVYQLNPLVPIELDQLIQRLVSMDERQRPTSAIEVQQELLKIKQHAAEPTTGLNPVLASAPTQYTPPAPVRSANPALMRPPTVPITPPSTYGQIPSIAPTQRVQARGASGLAAVWSTGFTILFGLMLALTIVGSAIAFNTPQPYGSDNLAGLDHVVELGLSVLLIVVALAATTFVGNSIAIGILFLTALAGLLSGSAFLLQTISDVQNASSYPLSVDPNLFFTIGLAAAAIISLLWLTRPYTLLDRIVLLIPFGTALVCAVIQYFFSDEAVLRKRLSGPENLAQLQQALNNEAFPKQMLILIALIMLILGILIATRTERVRRMATS